MTSFGDLGCPGVDVDEWRKQNRVPLFPGKVNRWVLVRTTRDNPTPDDRYIVQYETGLRPSTIQALSVPEHYSPGQDFLNITSEIDKVRWARQVPLTTKARAALDACCPPKGSYSGGTIYGRPSPGCQDAAARSGR